MRSHELPKLCWVGPGPRFPGVLWEYGNDRHWHSGIGKHQVIIKYDVWKIKDNMCESIYWESSPPPWLKVPQVRISYSA